MGTSGGAASLCKVMTMSTCGVKKRIHVLVLCPSPVGIQEWSVLNVVDQWSGRAGCFGRLRGHRYDEAA